MIEAAKRRAGATAIWTDHKNIADTFTAALQHSGEHTSSNLWVQLQHELHKDKQVEVRWVPSHTYTLEEGEAPCIAPAIFACNAKADEHTDGEATQQHSSAGEAGKAN